MSKTAMQQAIDKIDFVINMWNNSDNEMDFNHTINVLKQDLIELKELEKKQMCEMYVQGRNDNHLDFYPVKHAEEHFNIKFKENEK